MTVQPGTCQGLRYSLVRNRRLVASLSRREPFRAHIRSSAGKALHLLYDARDNTVWNRSRTQNGGSAFNGRIRPKRGGGALGAGRPFKLPLWCWTKDSEWSDRKLTRDPEDGGHYRAFKKVLKKHARRKGAKWEEVEFTRGNGRRSLLRPNRVPGGDLEQQRENVRGERSLRL